MALSTHKTYHFVINVATKSFVLSAPYTQVTEEIYAEVNFFSVFMILFLWYQRFQEYL